MSKAITPVKPRGKTASKAFVRAPAASAAASKKASIPGKVRTLRLSHEFETGLKILKGVLGIPVSKMVNVAVGEYLDRMTAKSATDLGSLLEQIKAYRERDPDFKRSAEQFRQAEMSVVGDDPAEGTRVAPARVTSKAAASARRRSHA